MKVKGKKKKRPAQELCTRPTTLAASFFDDAAAVAPFDDDDDDDAEDDEDGYDQHGEELDRGMSESEYDSDSEDDDDERPVETSGDLSEMLVAERENSTLFTITLIRATREELRPRRRRRQVRV
jgi:hypothetical protein